VLVPVLLESILDSIVEIIFRTERVECHVDAWLAIGLENCRAFEVIIVV
jgi:hypothetical protein